MAAYMIFIRESEVRDPEAMERYRSGPKNKGPHPVKPLVVYGELDAVEGEAPDGVVVLEFPDMETARNWYNSPEYQEVIPYRLQAADYRSFIVDGWTPPSQ